jgi:hypothetical protein
LHRRTAAAPQLTAAAHRQPVSWLPHATTTPGLLSVRAARAGSVRLVAELADQGGAPTAAEMGDDRRRALQLLAASVLGIMGYIGGPDWSALSAFGGVYAGAVVNRLAGRRIWHGIDMLNAALEDSGLSLEEFLDLAVSDDKRQELLARALTIAQDAALRARRRGLGRSLSAGITGDDAKINEEHLFMRAVADVDEAHLRLLGHMAHPVPGSDGRPRWTAAVLEAADPGLVPGVMALLGTLELHGLVQTETDYRSIPGAMRSTTTYSITEPGRHFLGRLEADMETVAKNDP